MFLAEYEGFRVDQGFRILLKKKKKNTCHTYNLPSRQWLHLHCIELSVQPEGEEYTAFSHCTCTSDQRGAPAWSHSFDENAYFCQAMLPYVSMVIAGTSW